MAMPQHPVCTRGAFKMKGDDVTDILQHLVGDVQSHHFLMRRFFNILRRPPEAVATRLAYSIAKHSECKR